MGTTSEKLTYLNTTKQKLKQAINNIGGEVTDETTFREYVNQLENAYDRLPKTEFEEGESVTLENTLKGKLDFDDGKVGIGQSSQDGTPTPSTPIAINSVTGNQDVVVKDGNNNTIATYQLSLGDIELNAIGNYTDELIYDVENDRVYKLQNIKKVTFNGTETGWAYYHVAEGELFRYTRLLDNKLDSTIVNYSNYYKGIPSTAVRANNEFYINTTAGESAGGISIMDGRFTDVEDYKDWLSTHNLEIYYVLATPTLTEITDTTIINQVKALYNAHSNNGTTIITSNGNLPMIIKARGLKGE